MKPISALLVLPFMLASCTHKEDAPLLTGTIAANDFVLVTAYYDIDGDPSRVTKNFKHGARNTRRIRPNGRSMCLTVRAVSNS